MSSDRNEARAARRWQFASADKAGTNRVTIDQANSAEQSSPSDCDEVVAAAERLAYIGENPDAGSLTESHKLEERLREILRRKCAERAPQELRERVLSVLRRCTTDTSEVVHTERTEVHRSLKGEEVSRVTVTTDAVTREESTTCTNLARVERTSKTVSRVYFSRTEVTMTTESFKQQDKSQVIPQWHMESASDREPRP